jgi:hypothetical protein
MYKKIFAIILNGFWFYTSDYKMDWMPSKKKSVPRLFKDELGIPIGEYVKLRSTMYSREH